MVLRRRTKKLTKAMVRRMTGTTILTCRECNEEEVEVPADTKSVVCAYCVQKWIAPPANYNASKEKSDKPRGWHFKTYYEHNGVVYAKGVEVTDADEIAKLRKEHGPKPKKTTKATKPVKAVKTVKAKVVAKTKNKKRGKTYARTSR